MFEAALDDQELFDDLAREQALKELLEEPGVKARLIGALAPRRQKAGWPNAWMWAATGAFAVAVIAGIVLFEKPRELQIAQVTAPAAPEQAVPVPVVPAPVVSPQVVSKEAAPDIPAPASKKTAPRPSESERAEAEALKAEPPPAPAPAPAAPRQTNAPAAVGTLGGVAAGDLAAGGGGGGGAGGRGGAAAGGANRAMAQSFAALAAKPAGFSFNYSVTPEGTFRIVPAANGFLSVGANNGSTISILFSSRPLQAGAVTEVQLPADCVSALVAFSAREMPAAVLNITGPLDAPAGSKSDPNPTLDSILTAIIPVKR